MTAPRPLVSCIACGATAVALTERRELGAFESRDQGAPFATQSARRRVCAVCGGELLDLEELAS